jgi:hypothetical protein
MLKNTVHRQKDGLLKMLLDMDYWETCIKDLMIITCGRETWIILRTSRLKRKQIEKQS